MRAEAPPRRPIVGGNWKMNTNLRTAEALAGSIVRQIGGVLDAEIVLFPPFPNLQVVYELVEGSALQLGGQDVFWEDAGAYTGEVSTPMLMETGCDWVIVGHSERRRLLGESSKIVNRKLRAVLRHPVSCILAIGETRDERHAGQTQMVLEQQLYQSLQDVGIDDMDRVVIAYEPVWAIGTGETATPEQAEQAHKFVRHVLTSLYDENIAQNCRIQYGGSVTPGNARELMAQRDIDGALVGGASLKPDDFAAIVEAARPRPPGRA